MLIGMGGAYERLVKINKCRLSNEMNVYCTTVDPAGIRRFGPPHIPSPKPRIFNVYVESGKTKRH
jgi:hypothetical protein